MRFEHPHLLWLIAVLVPLLALFFAWSQRRKAKLLSQFIESRLLPNLTAGVSTARQRLRAALVISAVVCLVIAVARPQWGFSWEDVKQRGLDIVVAIDTSKSMLAEDVTPNRLARAKYAALDLLQQARLDRLGLVAFSGSAFLMCPLTFDDEAFRQSVNALDVEIIPKGGTALAAAIEEAQKAFKDEADNYKVLVLFTDGEDHDPNAAAAAERAAKAGMLIYTIGIGSAEGELLRVHDKRGRPDFIKDQNGNVVKSRLNESLLRDIATKGGGFYLPLRGARAMDELYVKGLGRLPKSESDSTRVRRYHERYVWPLAAAMLLLTVETLLPRRSRQRSSTSTSVVQPKAAAVTALLLLCSLMPLVASPSSARKQYEAGQYDQALKEYRQLMERKPDDPRLKFNAGASAYRDGQLAEAVEQFTAATAAQDLTLQQRAYYNLGNSLFKLGEQLPEAPAMPAPENPGSIPHRISAWEQSLQSFTNAIALNPQDEDAKQNYEFVKRKLEELKQQQEQQQQNNQDNKDPRQDDQDKQQQRNQPDQQQKSDQEQSDQRQQDEPEQQQDQQPAQNQEDPPREEQPPSSNQEDQRQQDQPSANQSQQAQAQPGQMTPREARQLLDAQRGQELLLRPVQPARESPPARDW